MKKHILIIGLILLLVSCEKDTAPSNPCDTQQETSAAFTIKEATIQQINTPNLKDFLMDTDSCYMNSVFFEALQHDADSFIWQIGTEPEPRYGKQVNVVFPDVLRGTTFTIRLIVKRKPNTRCFPNDDGIDTVTRSFYFLRFNEPLSWEGTYYGSDDNKPDSMYTIVLGHSYNDIKKEDIIKVFGVPRGCTDTVSEWIGGHVAFKNVWFQRDGLGCDQKIIRGILKNGDTYTILYGIITVVDGRIINTTIRFKGTKIN
jgi:hypothetical protein